MLLLSANYVKDVKLGNTKESLESMNLPGTTKQLLICSNKV